MSALQQMETPNTIIQPHDPPPSYEEATQPQSRRPSTRRSDEREHWDEKRQDWVESKRFHNNRIINRLLHPLQAYKLQAVFEHTSHLPTDLSFSRGQYMRLKSISPNETWLRASYTDSTGTLRIGNFPAKTCQYSVKALHGFEGGSNPRVGTLNFPAGQIIEVLGLSLSTYTWLYGRYRDDITGKLRSGSFPRDSSVPHHAIIATDPTTCSTGEREALREEERKFPARTAKKIEKIALFKNMDILSSQLEKGWRHWERLSKKVTVLRSCMTADTDCIWLRKPLHTRLRGWLCYDIQSTIESMQSLRAWLDLEKQNHVAIEENFANMKPVNGSMRYDTKALAKRLRTLEVWLRWSRKDLREKEEVVHTEKARLEATKGNKLREL